MWFKANIPLCTILQTISGFITAQLHKKKYSKSSHVNKVMYIVDNFKHYQHDQQQKHHHKQQQQQQHREIERNHTKTKHSHILIKRYSRLAKQYETNRWFYVTLNNTIQSSVLTIQ